MIIAIDGPAGSGKSTISKILAKKLGFIYLDTGAMYRALTLKVIIEKVLLDDEPGIIKLARDFDFKYGQESRVFLDGKDVTESIRTPEIEKAISKVCGIPEVRGFLVALQRKIAGSISCVTEGRDTTTVVFPEAQVKVFLDASVGERARRRLLDFQKKSIAIDLETVKKELQRRDLADCSRSVGALKKAPDAFVLDTTGLTIEQVAQKIYDIAKVKMSS
jgi:CMP/dCMP kinase